MAVLAADTKCSGMMSLGPTMQSIRLSSCGPRAHCSGYEWGMPTGQPFTHRQVRLRRMTCMERNRRRRPTMPHLHPRSLKYVPADTCRRPRGYHRGPHDGRPRAKRYVRTCLMSPSITFPGSHVTARISACRPPDAPRPAPAGNGAPLDVVAVQVECRGHVSVQGWRRGRQRPRTCSRRGMARPLTAIPQMSRCFSITSSSKSIAT